MQELIVSVVRLTAAMTLYGFEQLQTFSNVAQGGEDFSKVLDELEVAFDSLTDALADKIDENKRNTLRSFTRVAEDVVGRTFESIDRMDPRELLRRTNDFWRRSSETISDWLAKPASSNGSEPKPAADVLV